MILRNETKPTKSVIHHSLPMCVALIIALISLWYLSNDSAENRINFDELALGTETSIYLNRENVTQILCHDLTDAYKCIGGYNLKPRNIEEDLVLWLGNSQLHSINQMKPADETATVLLQKSINALGKNVLTFSQPNANLQEHYVLLNYLIGKLPISTLVLPVVFDDMRETGIRHNIVDAFEEEDVSRRLEKTEIGKELLLTYKREDMHGNEMAASGKTSQDSIESFLNSGLESLWPAWGERAALRASFLYGFLYKTRNWLFNINPSSIRKMIPGRYAQNFKALSGILATAEELDMKVLLYIAPIRNDVQIPYDAVEYDIFKNKVNLISNEYDNVFYKNLEGIVPAKFWGTKPSTASGIAEEIDFMHFQAGGHEILSNAILLHLRSIWNED